MSTEGKTIAVLSGGGAHGAYEIGALEYYITRLGRRYDAFYGVSVGALIAAYMGMYPKEQQASGILDLKNFWKPLRTEDIYETGVVGDLFGDELQAPLGISIFDSKPLNDLILKMYDEGRSKGSGITTKVGAVSWNTGKYRIVDQTIKNFPYWIMASASYPMYFRPVKLEGQYWTDGGVRNMTPIRQAILDGYDDIDIIVCENTDELEMWEPKGEKAFPGYLGRLLLILLKELASTDLKTVGISNAIVELSEEYSHVRMKVLQPDRPLAGDSLKFDPPITAINMNRGYKDAQDLSRRMANP